MESKATKLLEYGTDPTTHELCYAGNVDQPYSRVRNSNTFMSKVLSRDETIMPDQAYRIGLKIATKVHELSKDKLFAEKPLNAKIQRTSY